MALSALSCTWIDRGTTRRCCLADIQIGKLKTQGLCSSKDVLAGSWFRPQKSVTAHLATMTIGYNAMGTGLTTTVHSLSQTVPMCRASKEQSTTYGYTAKGLTKALTHRRIWGCTPQPEWSACPPGLGRDSLEANSYFCGRQPSLL